MPHRACRQPLDSSVVRALQNHVTFQLHPNVAGTHVFPFIGRATLGADLTLHSSRHSPMLLEGFVQIAGKYKSTRFTLSEIELEAGDKFTVMWDSARTDTNHLRGFGIVRVDDGQGLADARGMSVVYHVDGTTGLVSHFGTEGHEIRPTLLQQIVSHPVRSVLALLGVTYFGAVVAACIQGLLPHVDNLFTQFFGILGRASKPLDN